MPDSNTSKSAKCQQACDVEITPLKMASAIGAGAEIYDVFVSKSSSELKAPRGKVFDCLRKERLVVKTTDDVEYRVVGDEGEREINVAVKYTLSAFFPRKSRKLNVLSIEAVVNLSYVFPVVGGPPAKEAKRYFQAFADVNGVYNSWPYFRELVQSAVARMGLPPVVVPLKKFMDHSHLQREKPKE